MTNQRIRILLILLVAGLFAFGVAGFRQPAAASRERDNFLHSSNTHRRLDCSSCHKNPTSNWTSARGYPDVADYPGHASCVQCHHNDFFSGNRPAICTICHVSVSPRGKTRFSFPAPNRKQEFETIFPHDVHQNIIAFNQPNIDRKDVAVAHFVRAGFSLPDDDDDGKSQFNNCTICHPTATSLPQYTTLEPIRTEALVAPAADNFSAKAQFFKANPNDHASCFNCHYQGQKPIRTDCAGCHRLTSPYFESNVVRRFSLKYDHTTEQHAKKDCTVCHLRITQTSDLRTLVNADVPLLSCSSTSCHGQGKQLSDEINKRQASIADKTEIFQCNYCHTSAIGSFKIPFNHLEQVK